MSQAQQPPESMRAAEYVLGTLAADASVELARDLEYDSALRAEVAYWEQRLGTLGLALEPVQPPLQAWSRIRERAGLEHVHSRSEIPADGAAARDRRPAQPAAGLAHGAGWWRSLAIAASLAVVVLAGLLLLGSVGDNNAAASDPAYASVVYDQPTGTSWLVTAERDSDKMSVQAMGNIPVPDDKALRAWLKPVDGKPILLGQWPHTRGHYVMNVPDAAAKAMAAPARLMVSMEDRGAHINAPNGKIMWISPIARPTS